MNREQSMPAEDARSSDADARSWKWVRFDLVMAAVIWLTWLLAGGTFALQSIARNWRIAITMIFGSLVGGGTSEGGGAVAFPIFTKLLHIPAHEACLFSFAIQSVGMGAASLSILRFKVPIERRALFWGGIGGVSGMLFSTYEIGPHIAPDLVRIAFTVMVSSLGVALFLVNRAHGVERHSKCSVFGARERGLLVLAGVVGGIMSGLAGCGENIAVFTLMVLLFRVSEKVVTPTTVILMTIVTIAGFAFHALVIRDFDRNVTGYWLAAVPIVAIGAPVGAVICSRMSRRAIVYVLLVLICAEFASTVLIIPMSTKVAVAATLSLIIMSTLNWAMSISKRYVRKPDAPLPEITSSEATLEN